MDAVEKEGTKNLHLIFLERYNLGVDNMKSIILFDYSYPISIINFSISRTLKEASSN